jgi:predicted NBD/HSP70 family sugar kinase
MNSAATGVLGIDVGGTKIAAGIVDPARGAILLSETIATKAACGGALVLAEPVNHAFRWWQTASRSEDIARNMTAYLRHSVS